MTTLTTRSFYAFGGSHGIPRFVGEVANAFVETAFSHANCPQNRSNSAILRGPLLAAHYLAAGFQFELAPVYS